MRRAILWCGFLLACVSPAPAADNKSDAKSKTEAADKLVTAGQLTGILKNLGEGRSLTVEVTLKYLEPNLQAQADFAQKQPQWAQRQVEILRNTNLAERQQQLQQLAQEIQQARNNLVQVKETTKDIELQGLDDMNVRVLVPPPAFDDKGNLRKYTPEELKELKGKEGLPGFASDFDSLRTGQTVTVMLVKKKDAPKPSAKDKDAPKEKVQEKDKDMTAAAKPLVRTIVILAEPK